MYFSHFVYNVLSTYTGFSKVRGLKLYNTAVNAKIQIDLENTMLLPASAKNT